ncbi:MAG: DUF3696 domain-containing protein [Clostridia bacterium]|nr:DUF3696 domain-containing protein [Clostridia bacterium]
MKSFRLKSIKGFLDTGEIEIKPITIFIGENSSGKSSIVRFPLVIKQTFLDATAAPLLFFGNSIDYGNYEDVVFDHVENESIEFEISFNYSELTRIGPRTLIFENQFDKLKGSDMRLLVNISCQDREMMVNKFILSLDSSEAPIVEFCVNNNKQTLTLNMNEEEKLLLDRNEYFFDKFIPDIRWMLAISEKSNSNLELASQICNTLQHYFNVLSNKIFYIGPFRKTPERYYRYTDNLVNYVGRSGEFASVILGQDLRNGKRIINKVSDWLSKHINFALEVEDLKGQLFKIMIRDLKTDSRNNIIDVGHGLSQLIPILVQTYMSKTHSQNTRLKRRPNYTVIEQPELHLHPSAQACLADLFLEAIRSNNEYFLIETHSEHMILRLRKYIADGSLPLDKIAIYFTEKDSQYGSSKVKRLNIDEFGTITNWPKGFFSQDYLETLELQKIIDGKRQKGDAHLW